jgi:hypothetical protein
MTITISIDGENYELKDETAATLREIADKNNVTVDVALKQAILNEKFLEEQTDSGAKLLIEKNGSLNELILRPATKV